MSPIKRTRHAVYDLKYHFVWTPKYRKQILKGEVVGDAVTAEIIRNYIRYQDSDHESGQLSLWD